MITNESIIKVKITRGTLCRLLTATVNEMFDENLNEASRKMWKDIHDELEKQLDEFDNKEERK